MNRKKQSSLSSRSLKLRTQRIISREPQQTLPSMKKPSANPILTQINGFIQYYHMIKQQHCFNLSSHNLFQETHLIDTNNEEFCFDVDLGVPYVESQHLDSGFEYDEKANETINFPKVSSAKEIFTSVLDFSKSEQIEEENFTDRENNEESLFGSSSKSSKFQKRSRKEVPLFIQQNQDFSYQNDLIQNIDSKSTEGLKTSQDQQISLLIMKKLKITAENRKQKLKFWNNKLFQLNKSSNHSQKSSKVSLYLNQQNSFSQINSNSLIFVQSPTEQKPITKSQTKRSKFEKEPTNKKSKIHSKANQNVKVQETQKKNQVKKAQINLKKDFSGFHPLIKKLKDKESDQNYAIKVNNRNLSNRSQEIILRNKSKSLSKDRSLTKKLL